jgi:hypothetical protein
MPPSPLGDSTRLTRRERAWLPLEYVRTVGPLHGVTVDAVRAALTGLHAADPAHRAVSRLHRRRARWEHLDAGAFAGYVREAVAEGPADPDELRARLVAERPGHHPVRILVGGGHVALKVAHAYGDAGPVNVLLREILTAAHQGLAARLPAAPRARLALACAGWQHFGASGRKLRAGLRVTLPPPAAPAPSRAWRPELTGLSTRSAGALGRMRSWRDAHAPGATTSAIAFAAFTAALGRLGLDPDLSGGVFLADARRYLPAGVRIDSNFCWGQYLTPADLADPVSVHQAIRAELASGRMLTMMALREIRIAALGAPHAPTPYPARVPAAPRPRLTFGNQGRHDLLGDLPWAAAPADRVNSSLPTLAAPDGISLGTSEMNGVLHLDVAFHASTYDPDTVRRALHLVCEDPAGLVTAGRR